MSSLSGVMTYRAAIALGSNLGDREANLSKAVDEITVLGTIEVVSPFYDTEPVGYLDQPRFLNGALLLETRLDPLSLLSMLLSIEKCLGRERSATLAKGPRTVDLDLLFVDDLVLHTPALTLPHPALAERRFVLQPLADIAPALRHPVTGLTVMEMLARVAQ